MLAAMMAIIFEPTSAFSPRPRPATTTVVLRGYLDDLSKDLRAPNPSPNSADEGSREASVMAKEDLDRAGPGSWASYVEFDEVRTKKTTEIDVVD
jgi:hypothetical protein